MREVLLPTYREMKMVFVTYSELSSEQDISQESKYRLHSTAQRRNSVMKTGIISTERYCLAQN